MPLWLLSYARITMMRGFIGWVGAILGIGLAMIGSVHAQITLDAKAFLFPPQLEDFPLLQPMLKVFTAQGAFIHGLSASDIQLYENGSPVPLQEVREQRVGVQAVFVLNPGATFLVRNVQGESRYDLLMNALVDWARRRLGSTIDDLSIVVTEGPSRSHLSNPLELFYTLASYRVPNDAAPSLEALLKGIEIAADPSPRDGMEKVVIFITAPLSGDQSLSIQNAIEQAQKEGVRIFVWLLTTEMAANPQLINDLRPLAEETQGVLWVLSKPEENPDPEKIFEPLRYVYALRYLASAADGGERGLEAEIRMGEDVIRTQPIAFRLDLQLPNVIFLAPPAEIVRQPAESDSRISVPAHAFEPQSWRFNLLIEFPDGRTRSIKQMRVFADENMILERLEAPFDSFVWDLREYTQTGQHILQVEVVDELGLSAKTVPLPILIKVVRPLPSPSRMVQRNIPLIVVSISITSVAALALVLAMRGQLVPTSQRLSRRLGTKKRKPLDPLRQPVPIAPLPPSKTSPPSRYEEQSPSLEPTKPAVFAHLSPLGGSDEGETSRSFAMVTEELTIGRNAVRNLLVIDDPTVEGIHARLERQTDGRFRLYDLGSLSGTWVNYTPVSQEGVMLEDGDLIHIGRVGFRFVIRERKHQVSRAKPREGSG